MLDYLVTVGIAARINTRIVLAWPDLPASTAFTVQAVFCVNVVDSIGDLAINQAHDRGQDDTNIDSGPTV
jgi:hypothetical protein